MGSTRRSLHMSFNLEGPILPSNRNGFGQRMLSPSTGSSHGCLCKKKKFLRWISSRLGVGHAILFAHSAALRLKQPNTCLQCPFAQRVWELVQVWTHDLVTKPAVNAIIEDRWIQSPQNKPKDQQRTKAAVIRYTAWNL